MTDLERIIAELRADGAADTLYAPERMTYYADRLAALAGAAPVAWVNPLELECLQEFGGMIVATGDEEAESERTCPLFTHAPAKAREVTEADVSRAYSAWANAKLLDPTDTRARLAIAIEAAVNP